VDQFPQASSASITRRTFHALALALAASVVLVAQHTDHAPPVRPTGRALNVGTVKFQNSGAPAAQAPFLRGIALLHSYEYYDARVAFREAEDSDPRFALAYWAGALTHSQFDWGTEDLPAARAALARLAPTRDQRLALAGTARERAFGATVETFFEDRPLLDRALSFAASMRDYAAGAPADLEAAAFAARGALYVLRYAPPADRVRRAEEAIALAERVVAANPKHPGGVHYLIHATDSPRFAAKGLAAARVYDKLAPDADHALHMPSHIFLQLGLWGDVAAANERAWTASRAWVAQGGHSVAELGWHSLQWLQYGYLQQGRYQSARALIDSARAILDPASPADLAGYPDVRYAIETMTFQYGAETGRWDLFPRAMADAAVLAQRAADAASVREKQMATTATYQAAVAAVLGRGDTSAALAGARALRSGVESLPAQEPRRMLAEGLATQLDALAARANGEPETAIALLNRIVGSSREAGTAPLGPPTVIPPSERLGALLLEVGRPREAILAYEGALSDRPNRSAALLGLARAKAAAGDQPGATAMYAKLLANWRNADSEGPAIAEVRAATGRARKR
jgi:tetratricopeptide (TPR) repeat protein